MAEQVPQDGTGVSVIIPVCNEATRLEPLREALAPVLESLGETFEVIFVDDGSTDATWETLRRFHEEDPRMQAIRFARSFGQQHAYTAGLRRASGHVVVITDASLEVHPSNISAAIDKLREGYDVVFGQRDRPRDSLFLRLASGAARMLVKRLTGFAPPDRTANLLVLNERLVRTANHYNEHARDLKGLFTWLAHGRHASVPVVCEDGPHGLDRYSVRKRVHNVLQFVVAFSVRPLYLSFAAAAVVFGAALLLAVAAAVLFARDGWAGAELLVYGAVLSFVGALQLAAIGVLGEYIGRIYGEVRKHPPYVIADVLGHGARPPAAGNGES